jgi:hypothetical protein
MILIPLSKARAKELETSTTRIEGFFPGGRGRLSYYNIMFSILGWYHKYDLRPGYVREQWKKLTELFGIKPTYYINHSCRNALWAFKWEEQEFIIYKDQRGLTIQVVQTFDKKKTRKFLKLFEAVLYGKVKVCLN